jgi:hypothetical protein
MQEVQDMLTQVTWTMDGPLHLFDCISYPQVTWAKKRDDCDGFASLAAALLHQLDPDYHPVLVTAGVRPIQSSHTVCVFRTPDGLAFFDNSTLRGGCQTYGDVVALISQDIKRLVCWDVRNHFSLKTLEFHVV